VVKVRSRSVCVAVLLSLLLTACGNGDGGGNGSTPSPTESGAPTDPATDAGPAGQPVGQVISVLESLARVQGERAAGGDPIFAGSELATDVRGRATFSVLDILEDCQIQSDSRLTVAPADRNPLAVRQGSVICRSKAGFEEFRIEAGQAEVGFLDPIFQLVVAPAQTDVRVDYGFVQVRKPGGSASRLVGPGSEYTVGRGALRQSRATRFQMDSLGQFDVEALNRLRAGLPRDVRGFPSSANSRILPAVRSQRTLRLGFDDIASEESEEFVDALAGVFSARWGIRAEVGPLEREEASRALAEGGLDIYISPAPVPGAAQLPLFGDEDERTWFLRVRPDPGFQGALEDFLKTILDRGEYASAYASSFGELPTYEAVRSLVYPNSRQANRSQWRPPDQAEESPSVEAKVSRATLAASPAKFSGDCPVKITLAGQLVVTSPGDVEYQYLRQDGSVSGMQQVHFEKAGTYELKNPPSLEVQESGSGWWILVVPSQGVQSDKASYTVTCESPPVVD
jgi:hypothetical protein